MSNWNMLDDNAGGDSIGADDVQYVGVVEEEAPGVVREPRQQQQQRRQVRVPQQRSVPVYPVRQQRRDGGVIGAPNKNSGDLVSFVNMPYGKQLGLTNEAMQRMQSAPIGMVNGQAAQRLEPGTYVMYGPNRAGAMGDDDDEVDYDRMARTGEAAPGTGTPYQRKVASSGTGSNTDTSWLGDMFGAIGRIGANIATSVSSGRQSQREQETERLRIRTEAEADAEARDIAFQEAQMEHAERLARIQSGAAELEELRRQQEEAAALRSGIDTVTTTTTGVSPLIWVLVSVLGLGAVGGIVYFVARSKGGDEEDFDRRRLREADLR